MHGSRPDLAPQKRTRSIRWDIILCSNFLHEIEIFTKSEFFVVLPRSGLLFSSFYITTSVTPVLFSNFRAFIMQSPPRLFLDLKQPSDSKPPVVLHKTAWSQFLTYSFLKSLTEEHVEQLITRMVMRPSSTCSCPQRLRVAHVPSTTNACVSAFHIRCSERASSSQTSCLKWWWKPQAKHMARGSSKSNNLAYDHFKIELNFVAYHLRFCVWQKVKIYQKGEYILRKGTIGTSLVCCFLLLFFRLE